MNIYFQLLHQHLIKNNRNIHTGRIEGTLKIIFGKYLLVTNTVSCGLLMATGDTIQQNIEKYDHKCKPFDWKRTGRMFIIGLVGGPPQHLFYKLLDKNIPNRDFKSILTKIILDQLIASPTCISIFLFGMGILEGNTWDATTSEAKEKFFKIYKAMESLVKVVSDVYSSICGSDARDAYTVFVPSLVEGNIYLGFDSCAEYSACELWTGCWTIKLNCQDDANHLQFLDNCHWIVKCQMADGHNSSRQGDNHQSVHEQLKELPFDFVRTYAV